MQIINVLGNNCYYSVPFTLEFCQSYVSRVRRHVNIYKLLSAGVVEFLYPLRISLEGVRRCDIFNVYLGPNTIIIAKSIKTGFL